MMMREDDERTSRRRFFRYGLLSAAGACVGSIVVRGATGGEGEPVKVPEDLDRFDWGYLVDTTRCIGCGSCVRACKLENGIPDRYFRTWVERYEIDRRLEVHVDSPDGSLKSFREDIVPGERALKAFFVPKICNHCRNSACTQVCPVGASYHSPDGVVLIDESRCMGCGYCVQACPYGCRYIAHPPGTADKCTLCYHRIHRGLRPACVEACPRKARLFGNLKDDGSPIRKALYERRYSILKPEMGTNPKCYYIGLDLEVK